MTEFERLEKWLAKGKSRTATVYRDDRRRFVCNLGWQTRTEYQDVTHWGLNMATAVRNALDEVKEPKEAA